MTTQPLTKSAALKDALEHFDRYMNSVMFIPFFVHDVGEGYGYAFGRRSQTGRSSIQHDEPVPDRFQESVRLTVDDKEYKAVEACTTER